MTLLKMRGYAIYLALKVKPQIFDRLFNFEKWSDMEKSNVDIILCFYWSWCIDQNRAIFRKDMTTKPHQICWRTNENINFRTKKLFIWDSFDESNF